MLQNFSPLADFLIILVVIYFISCSNYLIANSSYPPGKPFQFLQFQTNLTFDVQKRSAFGAQNSHLLRVSFLIYQAYDITPSLRLSFATHKKVVIKNFLVLIHAFIYDICPTVRFLSQSSFFRRAPPFINNNNSNNNNNNNNNNSNNRGKGLNGICIFFL